MSDPAISAARKVFTEYWPDQGDFEFNYSSEGRFGIEVAREMAKSVQELHRPTGWGGECVVCFDSEGRGIPWPCETAKRVYPSEEL
ncbi:Uncharacterised protein [Mycobacteroides abscessus subsp. massiliense]|uniref:hypothetical protein n=1 Tax=Mycobacteroides abscessus TaxID=36809 RepID=UPI0009A67E84|nr:hypothetical protein [Mycobacteroides abscessus]SKU70296.1 Uncharacterised protein [Mycobacteroides abscessus subsp. massiliense]SKU76702.1 Uncharacterised protein [Mycobacteroides abscessus subsp. massiliense]